jgi:hypothetical protein
LLSSSRTWFNRIEVFPFARGLPLNATTFMNEPP